MRYGSLVLSVVIALLVGLVTGLVAAPQFLASPRLGMPTSQEVRPAQQSRLTENSKNVVRVYGPDVYHTAVTVSQLIYPGPRTDAHPDAQPGVAILAPSGVEVEPFYAEALAAAALIHHPRNGPILFTDPTKARLNRGYLIVSPEIVGFQQQAEIDWLLEAIPEDVGAMPGMNDGTPPEH
ncbi:MAG: cell wall-binding repeat-containing protein [Chloroflexi bacterium]|nr:cell wall-binding repeat-containing protein [Chloroflexota bacterium]